MARLLLSGVEFADDPSPPVVPRLCRAIGNIEGESL